MHSIKVIMYVYWAWCHASDIMNNRPLSVTSTAEWFLKQLSKLYDMVITHWLSGSQLHLLIHTSVAGLNDYLDLLVLFLNNGNFVIKLSIIGH